MIREACVETYKECFNAVQAGANQLEVCSHMELDGLTPDMAMVEEVLSMTSIPVKVMIRCRGGDFIYTENEISDMMEAINKFKNLSIHGFVFGALKKDLEDRHTIDLKSVQLICDAAAPLPVTFHKAIDLCDDIIEESKKLRSFSNLKFILTSGGAPTAESGKDTLIKLKEAVSPHIEIIAAGKITHQNLDYIHQVTGLTYFHGRKIV